MRVVKRGVDFSSSVFRGALTARSGRMHCFLRPCFERRAGSPDSYPKSFLFFPSPPFGRCSSWSSWREPGQPVSPLSVVPGDVVLSFISPSWRMGLVGSITGAGKGCRGGTAAGLGLSADPVGPFPGLPGTEVVVRVLNVMMGLIMYVFIINISVALRGLRFNPSWHLTRPVHSDCNSRVPRAGSLSLGLGRLRA